ncbi:MAG: hypothetical protein IJW79_11355 [Clostridia bacterium]|nr:hypothetical protein [Clostridia bacterium]
MIGSFRLLSVRTAAGGWGLTTRLAHKLLRNMPIRPHETVTRKMVVSSRHFSECDGYVRTNHIT